MSFKKGGISSSEWDLTRFATKDGYIYQGVGGLVRYAWVNKKRS